MRPVWSEEEAPLKTLDLLEIFLTSGRRKL